jgi:hypothetical protein
MNPTPDTTAAAENGGNFDPRQAAALLDQTTLQARRKFEPSPPWLLVIRAFIALAAYGTVWLTVRDQHPYKYPTAAVVPVVIVLALINLGATLAVANRATTGVTGRSRLRPAYMAAMVAGWIGVFAVMGALAAAGVSDGIVYGQYPTAAPLILAGLVWAGVMAPRANWRGCATGLAIAVIGAGAAFAGPAGSWAVAGVGVCLVLLGSAAAIAWRQRA